MSEESKEHADASPRADALARRDGVRLRRTLALGALIFLVALGVRCLAREDARLEAAKVQWSVAADYRRVARLLAEGGAQSFFSKASPLADPGTLTHPPGYSILLALSDRLCGNDAPVAILQIVCDALAAVVIFLIVLELIGIGAGTLAGLMSALSPQFSWNSVTPLPDTLAVLPALLAIYCLALVPRRVAGDESLRGVRDESRRADAVRHTVVSRRTFVLLFAAGALVGVSCWLRANALLLAPFLAAACALLFTRGMRLRASAALLAGAITVVAPLTIRNAVVFRSFIPLSLGAGQTLLEGIGDYDRAARFGVPQTDLAIARAEAQASGRPDYAGTLFGADGVERERSRVRRGLGVIGAHPAWFVGVMARRGASMLKLERAPLVSAEPAVTHTLDEPPQLDGTSSNGDATQTPGAHQPAWSADARDLISRGTASTQAKVSLVADGGGQAVGDERGRDDQARESFVLRVEGDGTKRGDQFGSAPLAVASATDYVLTVRVKALRGRARLCVVGDGGEVLNSTLAEESEGRTPGEQPWQMLALPFVSRRDGAARLVVRNEEPRPALLVSGARLAALGRAAGLWTRYPRLLVHAAQRLFLTAVVLPPALAGLLLLARARRRRALVLLVAVPAYYMTVQSALHTEYRYVLAADHFMFALAAVALAFVARELRRRVASRNEPVSS